MKNFSISTADINKTKDLNIKSINKNNNLYINKQLNK